MKINDTIGLFNKPFTLEDDINIPIVDKKIYDTVIIPKIIECGGIPKDKLIIGREYNGLCRNSYKATWNGVNFEYERTKFGSTYIEKINHFEDDDGYDLFIPLELIND